MLVCAFLSTLAHETAGAARTRSSPRPLLRVALRPLFFWGPMNLQNSGAVCRENARVRHRPRRRTIQYSATPVMESRTRGVLDPPVKPGDDGGGWSVAINGIARSARDEAIQLFPCCSRITSLALAMTRWEPTLTPPCRAGLAACRAGRIPPARAGIFARGRSAQRWSGARPISNAGSGRDTRWRR
jgi:hypothetical protein